MIIIAKIKVIKVKVKVMRRTRGAMTEMFR
jgi:hypothetical protein